MYYRNEQDYSNNESELITTDNRDINRRKHTDKGCMKMPYGMQPMSYCPWMATCSMQENPIMGQYNMMPQMDPGDPDPRFGRRRFHHFHRHFHHHFFHPFFPFFPFFR